MSILQKIAKYTAQINRPFESLKINKYAGKEAKHHPVFIVGAPRSGSTILYQLMTNNFNVLYPDNLVELFRRNFYLGFWLSQLIYKENPHNCFESEFGQTKKCGLHAPSECGEFWYRWLPRDNHYFTRNDVSSQALNEIKKNIYSVINRFEKIIVFKNLNAGQRLDLINAVAPESKIIFIKRNPLYTVQSILEAKQRLGIDDDKLWSIKPRNFLALEKLPLVEQIVKQVFFLEKQILDDLNLFKSSNTVKINYSDILVNNGMVIDFLHNFLGKEVGLRYSAFKPEIKSKEKQKIEDSLFNEIKTEIEKYDWEEYGIK